MEQEKEETGAFPPLREWDNPKGTILEGNALGGGVMGVSHCMEIEEDAIVIKSRISQRIY